MVNCCIFVVGTLNNCVNRACILAVSAINAFCHVDIVASCSSGSIGSWLAFYCYCVCWAGSCAQFACYASELEYLVPFLASCISPESMFSSKSGGKRTLLVGVVDGPFRFKSIEEGAEEHGIEVFRVHPLF